LRERGRSRGYWLTLSRFRALSERRLPPLLLAIEGFGADTLCGANPFHSGIQFRWRIARIRVCVALRLLVSALNVRHQFFRHLPVFF
jgi:hypothetical protein